MLYPKRFRAPRVLFLGCGRTALGLAQNLKGVGRLSGFIKTPGKISQLQQLSIVPILGDAAYRKSLKRLRALAQNIFVFVPPSLENTTNGRNIDQYSHNLSIILRQPAKFSRCFLSKKNVQKTTKIIYASTTGIYGDAKGAWVNESSRKRTRSNRSIKRLQAENTWLELGKKTNVTTTFKTSILRISGIYGKHLLPLERVQNNPVIFHPNEDRYTNHIALEDLIQVCRYALYRGRPQRSYNVSDTTPISYSDYLSQVANLMGAPAPKAVSAVEIQALVSPMMWSFLSESRRVCTQRLQNELKVPLQFPHTSDVLNAWRQENNLV